MLVRLSAPLLVLCATLSCGPGGPRARDVLDEQGPGRGSHPDLEAARELDQTGVRLFKEGRFADAMRYFRSAYRLGGPSSELWNVARCHERLDDAESAAHAIDEYLAQQDLAPPERAEAEREGQALRARPSVLTVTTLPPGASVLLDGKPTGGTTPLSFEVPAGAHSIAIRREGYAAETRPLEARFGRAVIVSLELAREGK